MTDNSLQEKTLCLVNKALALNNISKPQGEGATNISTNICPPQVVYHKMNYSLICDI